MKQKTKSTPRRTHRLTYRIRGAHTSGHREHIKRGYNYYMRHMYPEKYKMGVKRTPETPELEKYKRLK